MVKKTLLVLLAAIIVFVIVIIAASLSYPQQILSGDKIAVIQIHGTISSEDAIIPVLQAEPTSIIALLEQAEQDKSVRAIVLEINSPGGTAVASDEIAAKIKEINKTTVAWIGDMGASGAYWVASAADKIVAHPLSLTCSIGAYTVVGDWSVFFEEKLGMNYTVIKSGKYKDLGSPYKPLETDEEQILQHMIDVVQDEFVSEVAENRGLSITEVERIADGRPCIGKDALNYGLVDFLGNEETAFALAQELAGLEERNIVILESEKGIFEDLFGATLSKSFYSLGIGLGQELKGQNSIVLQS